MIRTIILFIIIFSIVVISHELGHFLIGRRNGIRVVEFSVGMGPTLFSFIKGGVKYSLKLLPIGGACMFDGEDGMDREEKEEAGGMHRRAGVEAQLPLSSETTDQRYGRVDLDAQGIAFSGSGGVETDCHCVCGAFFQFYTGVCGGGGADGIFRCRSSGDRTGVRRFGGRRGRLQPGDRITQINHEKIHFTGRSR